MLVIMSLCSLVSAEYTNDELMKMNLQVTSADFENDTAYSQGTGRIIRGRPNALILAKRAALTDARRGLLILRRELREGIHGINNSVSGYVPPVEILSETESGDLYIVEVRALLSELMTEGNENISSLSSSLLSSSEEEKEGTHEENHEDNNKGIQEERHEDSKDIPDVISPDNADITRSGICNAEERETLRE